MSKGMIITGIIILGVLTLACVNLIQNYQSGNELDYYLLKETTEAAMIDGVDWGYYRTSGAAHKRYIQDRYADKAKKL